MSAETMLCCRFKEIAEFVVQTLDPPSYAAAAGRRTCAYCGAEHSDRTYTDHLVDAHADFLFRCDECDTYVDRKDFVLHMSLHAVEYASKDRKEPKCEVKREKKPKKKFKDENEKENKKHARQSKGPEEPAKEDGKRKNGETQENEFSDHSDADYGFAPLPKSVFEAIEDSQDSQPNTDAAATRTESPVPQEKPDEPKPAEDPPVVKNGERSHKKARTCPICGKVYNASSSYFYHMKHFHRDSRDHECDVCGKKFGTRSGLAQHRTIHTGECRYECAHCHKRFRSRASLYIHEQTHNGVKRWKCNECQRSFRWRTHLLRHAARHAAKRQHTCDVCPASFSVRCDLLRHARTHTAGAFSCRHCSAAFAQRRYLRVHLQRKHPPAVD